jgi:hypothetical protein
MARPVAIPPLTVVPSPQVDSDGKPILGVFEFTLCCDGQGCGNSGLGHAYEDLMKPPNEFHLCEDCFDQRDRPEGFERVEAVTPNVVVGGNGVVGELRRLRETAGEMANGDTPELVGLGDEDMTRFLDEIGLLAAVGGGPGTSGSAPRAPKMGRGAPVISKLEQGAPEAKTLFPRKRGAGDSLGEDGVEDLSPPAKRQNTE